MTGAEDQNMTEAAPYRAVPRRTVVRGAAWSIPVIAAAVAVPAHAASLKQPNIAVTSGCLTNVTVLGGQIGAAYTMKETNGVAAGTVNLVEHLGYTLTSLLRGPFGLAQITSAIPNIVAWLGVQAVQSATAHVVTATNGSTLTLVPITVNTSNIASVLLPKQNADGTWSVSYTITRNVIWSNVAANSTAQYGYPLNVAFPPPPLTKVTQDWTLTSLLADTNSADNSAGINTALFAAC